MKQGKLQAAEEHEPEYLRLSQAERERNEGKKYERQETGKGHDHWLPICQAFLKQLRKK